MALHCQKQEGGWADRQVGQKKQGSQRAQEFLKLSPSNSTQNPRGRGHHPEAPPSAQGAGAPAGGQRVISRVQGGSDNITKIHILAQQQTRTATNHFFNSFFSLFY